MPTRSASAQRPLRAAGPLLSSSSRNQNIPGPRASLSSLPPELKLEIACCCRRNDAAAKSTFDRRWRPTPYSDDDRAAAWAEWTRGDYEDSEAEFTDSDRASTASSSGDSESGDDEDCDAVAPFGFEQDPEWVTKLKSIVSLHQVNREWHRIGMQVRHKSLQMSYLHSKNVNTFQRNFLPRHGHHFRTINFPMLERDESKNIISYKKLYDLVLLMPNLNGLLLPYTITQTPLVVVSFGMSGDTGSAQGLMPRRAMYDFIDDRTSSITSRDLRTSIELSGGGQLDSRDYDHICSLSDSTWSLTISTAAATDAFDYNWAMRLSHFGLPLSTPFPRLQFLVLSDIETRTDDEIIADHEHWVIPADLAADDWTPHDWRHIPPYLSPTGSYSDGTPHTPNDNLALYLLLLSSFDSSPLHTISLTGARLSFLLDSPAFLPFLEQHLSTLKQLIIVSGDNSPDGAAHRRLDEFCDASNVRLAFEGTYSPRDPPMGEMEE
ncbi:hypothetical protein RQP46_003193 [Phenoliferia psychrophenolica]